MVLFLNISGGELLVLIALIYLIFGPKKIPEIARAIGKGINTMKRATEDIKNEITKDYDDVKKEFDGVKDDINKAKDSFEKTFDKDINDSLKSDKS